MDWLFRSRFRIASLPRVPALWSGAMDRMICSGRSGLGADDCSDSEVPVLDIVAGWRELMGMPDGCWVFGSEDGVINPDVDVGDELSALAQADDGFHAGVRWLCTEVFRNDPLAAVFDYFESCGR